MSSEALSEADFPAFVQAVHGHEPFPWQRRLLAQVLQPQQGWPDVLAVPTGCGKTSTLDIALFALALEPQRFPRRIVLVIDRRVVVDQGYRHALKIQRALTNPEDAVAERVAQCLRALWDGPAGTAPLQCAVLRGGMPCEDAWAERPDRPVLALSTVDQVGSRLLFRGYGVSSRMASVHAGLMGHDTLFLLDEVHLAAPFAQTLLALRDRWRGFWPNTLPDRWGVVRLSATPGSMESAARVFEMPPGGEDDLHPVLGDRLRASKPATRREVSVKGRDETAKRAAFAEACARSAAALVTGEETAAGIRAVAVVVNRVAVAAEVARVLEARLETSADVALLTGRMRPLDRDAIVGALLPRIRAGRQRHDSERPLVVVATQCIEAGADFDFDALVTECASLDALRQRFGRLDRLGSRHRLGKPSPAVILARSDQLGDAAPPDAVYGDALKATWRWLGEQGESVDFGVRQLPAAQAELCVAPAEAPVLLPGQLDAWTQTHPQPVPDPEVHLWLHGPRRGEGEVQLVWRADVQTEELNLAAQQTAAGKEALHHLIARVAICPPVSLEALSVPISAARAWLLGRVEADVADAAITQQEDGEQPAAAPARNVLGLCWSGGESRVCGGSELRPGMTLVVPAGAGGLYRGNWSPRTARPVRDLAEPAQWHQKRRALLRLSSATLPEMLAGSALSIPEPELSPVELRRSVLDWLEALPMEAPAPWPDILAALRQRSRVVQLPDGGLALLGQRGREDVSTEDDGASFVETETSLAAHSTAVWRWAEAFARRLGLPDAICEDIALAAWLHDVGKADPRFQKWLVGGSEIRLALLSEPLAKSRQSRLDWAAMEAARRLSGYPDGYRHELLSVSMVQKNDELLVRAHDRDLVLHLIGSHHGWCRPFAPLADDPEDLTVSLRLADGPQDAAAAMQSSTRHTLARLDSGVTERFWRLNERYGWWGLAWLEAVLRLADHRASAQGPEVSHD